MSLPKIHEVGRLTSDPVLRYGPSGKPVASLNVAFNKRKKDPQTGEWVDAGALFVRCTAWDQMAENVSNSLSKGDEVFVSGELSMREYDRTDGSGKGQSLECNLYAIGPTLSRATAKVARATRTGADGNGSGTPVDDPWAIAPATKTAASAASTWEDEIPF